MKQGLFGGATSTLCSGIRVTLPTGSKTRVDLSSANSFVYMQLFLFTLCLSQNVQLHVGLKKVLCKVPGTKDKGKIASSATNTTKYTTNTTKVYNCIFLVETHVMKLYLSKIIMNRDNRN